MNWFQLQAYFGYLRKAKYRRGHGVHPPFAYDLVRHYFYERHPYYHFDLIDEIRMDLLEAGRKIEVAEFGAGSKKFKSKQRAIKDLVKYNATPQKQGELISRLVSFFKPQTIVELGTSLGLGTMYLALPQKKVKVYTIEGSEAIAKEAKINFQLAGVSNVIQQIGSFEDELPNICEKVDQIDMVYFDGHHDYEPTINYFNQCLAKASSSAVFIFDDIYWSAGMQKAWNEIIQHPSISISFDLFRFGITIVNKDVQKQHYIVRWP